MKNAQEIILLAATLAPWLHTYYVASREPLTDNTIRPPDQLFCLGMRCLAAAQALTLHRALNTAAVRYQF